MSGSSVLSLPVVTCLVSVSARVFQTGSVSPAVPCVSGEVSAEVVGLRADSASERMCLGLAAGCQLPDLWKKEKGKEAVCLPISGAGRSGRAPGVGAGTDAVPAANAKPSLYKWELNGPGIWENLSKVTC